MCSKHSTAPTDRRPTQHSCGAYILAGGSSSRFGGDKALAEVCGEPQLLRLRSILVSAGHHVEVVADRADRYETLGLQCLVDRMPHCGPLAGLATALRHRSENQAVADGSVGRQRDRAYQGSGWLLLISCDQLTWRAQWWDDLSSETASGIQAITFSDLDDEQRPFPQPIPGLYHTSIEANVIRQLDSGEHSLRSLLNNVNSLGISTNENPRRWTFNTPQELRELL